MKPYLVGGISIIALLPASAAAQSAETTDPLAVFDWMDGRWRGEAWIMTREGPVTLIQTERSGEMLDGRIRLVEGKGYNADGSVGFNALGVIAAAPEGGFVMRSWTLEQTGSFPIEVDGSGFRWEMPAGPGAVVRYVVTFDGATWSEVGHYVADGQEPTEMFRMELKRVDGTGWPAEGTLAPQ